MATDLFKGSNASASSLTPQASLPVVIRGGGLASYREWHYLKPAELTFFLATRLSEFSDDGTGYPSRQDAGLGINLRHQNLDMLLQGVHEFVHPSG